MNDHREDDDHRQRRVRDGEVVRVPMMLMDSVQRAVAASGEALAPHERRLVDAAALGDHYRALGASCRNQNGYAVDGSPAADAAAVQRAEDARAARDQRVADAWRGDAEADPMQPHPWIEEREEKKRRRREEEARIAASKQAPADAAEKALAARDKRLTSAWRGGAAA